MSVSKLLSHWRAEPTIGGNIVEWRTIPEREAQFVPFPEELHPSLRAALKERGFTALYSAGLRNERLLESAADYYRYMIFRGGDGGIGLYSHISAHIIPEATTRRLGGRERTELRPRA